MCKNHEVKIKIENDILITYCEKCGKILDTKKEITEEEKHQGGKQILHG